MLVLLGFDLAWVSFLFEPTSILFGMRMFVLYHYILEVNNFLIFFLGGAHYKSLSLDSKETLSFGLLRKC